jgi:hypothetical protein
METALERMPFEPSLPLKDQLGKLYEQTAIHVDSEVGVKTARMLLGKLAAARRELEAQYKERAEPLQRQLKALRDESNVYIKTCENNERTLERSVLEYEENEARRRQAEQAKLNAQHQKKLEKQTQKAIEHGKPLPVVMPPPQIEQVQKTQSVGGYQQTTRIDWKWRIEGVDNPELLRRNNPMTKDIPDHLFLLDVKTINSTVRGCKGTPVFGPPIVIYSEKSIVSKASI